MKNLYKIVPVYLGQNGSVIYRIYKNHHTIFGKIIWKEFDNTLLMKEAAEKALEELENFEKSNE